MAMAQSTRSSGVKSRTGETRSSPIFAVEAALCATFTPKAKWVEVECDCLKTGLLPLPPLCNLRIAERLQERQRKAMPESRGCRTAESCTPAKAGVQKEYSDPPLRRESRPCHGGGARGEALPAMTPHEFVNKWRGVELKERSASQSHLNDR